MFKTFRLGVTARDLRHGGHLVEAQADDRYCLMIYR
jgi:hypothetical protein